MMMKNLIPLLQMTRDDLTDIIPSLEDEAEQQDAIRRVREHDRQIAELEARAGRGDE